MDQLLIVLAVVVAILGAVALVTDMSVQRKVRKRSFKAKLSSCMPPPPVVHFGNGPERTSSSPSYPTNQEVDDWGSKGDVVKLRNSEPKIPTGGNAA